MLRVRELESGYGRVQVLRGVNLDVHEGEIVSVIEDVAGQTALLALNASILAAHPTGERRSATDGHSLQQGTSAWEGFGQ